jgi:hypothetical protein
MVLLVKLSVTGPVGDGAVRGQGRLSLRKGEGEGEDLFGPSCRVLGATPHLSPLPLPKGTGGHPGRNLRKIWIQFSVLITAGRASA